MTTQSRSNDATAARLPSHHLIFNPKSGAGEPEEKRRAIADALKSSVDLTVHSIEAGMDIEALVRQAIAEGADVVIAAGGDGTVSAVATALVDTPTPLGIIPTGTANGFANALCIPESIPEACDVIKQGCCHKVDTARCNDRMMLLTTNIGFEANLLTEMDREEKNKLGKLAIVINSLRELRQIDRFETWLDTSENSWHESATAVTIANAATVGMVLAQGPAEVAADDGKLSITLVTPKHSWGVLMTATKLFFSALRKRSVHEKRIRSCKATQVTVNTEPSQKVYVDGEPAGETPVTVSRHPQSLRVLVPEYIEDESDS